MAATQGGKRSGAGRPKVAPNDKRQTTTMRLRPWALEMLDAMDGSRGDIVEKLLQDELARSEKRAIARAKRKAGK